MGKTGQGLVDYAKGKLGTPYFYGSKMTKLTESFMTQMHKSYPSVVTEGYMTKARSKGMVGKVCVDCSGLIGAYREKQIGSAQLYSTAKKRLSTSDYKNWANGTVCWRSGHVGIFSNENGKYYVYEAKGIDYGTVKSAFSASSWSYGLTFSDITYDYTTKISGTSKGTNPYTMPTTNIKKGASGDGVKWIQWELVEAGYSLTIDGIFGIQTESAVKSFQKSAKITVDGVVGKDTRKALKVDKGD